MKPHEKHEQIVMMFKKGRPFSNIDKELGLGENESRRYLEKQGLFQMLTISGGIKKPRKGEEW